MSGKKALRIVDTHTGKIMVDPVHKLEFLVIGDYGKEANIKADFLGLHKEIQGVQHREVDLGEKMVVTISTQKGCPMKCQFCDVHKYGFHGNASIMDLVYEVGTAIEVAQCKKTKRFNLHFARMGEPTFNENVLWFTSDFLRPLVAGYMEADTIHPVVSTMLPKSNTKLVEFLHKWCRLKNVNYKGEAGLQFSINSTDEVQRQTQFQGRSLSLEEISKIARGLPRPVGRKYTLNFAVTEDTILDPQELSRLFEKDKWIVKITPIHKTESAIDNGFEITGYADYDVYRKFEEPLVAEGWDVIVFIPSEEEDSDRITCGNALIALEAQNE